MSTGRFRKRRSAHRALASVAKRRGLLHPRVQQVGPEPFGIVCFDCHKASSKFLLADFYGRVLIPPRQVARARPDRDDAVSRVRQAFTEHQLHDGLVASERTGRFSGTRLNFRGNTSRGFARYGNSLLTAAVCWFAARWSRA